MNVNAFKVCLHFAKVKNCIILEFNINTSSFRCIAVCSLGLWVCEELMQKNIHQQVKDAISVLGVTLKVSNPLRKEVFIYCSLITCLKGSNTLLCQLLRFLNECAPI